MWARRESHGNSAGSVLASTAWPDVNGPPGVDVVPVPAEFERSLTAGASLYILRGGQPLRLTLTVRGDALGARWTKPPKSQFYR